MTWQDIVDLLFPAQCVGCNALGSGLCDRCAPTKRGAIEISVNGLYVKAFGAYEGVVRAAVLALKDGRRDVADALGERIVPLIARSALLVPVPTTARRRRVRGMDGVTAVARTAASLCGATVLELLEQRAGDAQRGRDRSARLAAHGRFRCLQPVKNERVLLIDDVCTTGSTLTDCAETVRAAGGSVAGAVVVAVTKSGPSWEPHSTV